MDTKIPTSPLDYDVSMETIEKITRNSTYDATMLNKIQETHDIMKYITKNT
jgi:hypothetical protein